VTADDLAAELEHDLQWRLAELAQLRNALLPDGDPPLHAMRAIMVMQYAHVEGFTRRALELYVSAVNATDTAVDAAQLHLTAATLTQQFDTLRSGDSSEPASDEDGPLTRRVRRQVTFLRHVREVANGPLVIDGDSAVSMEANIGADVLKRSLYRLAIPPAEVTKKQYGALEFVKKVRNEIAHGETSTRLNASTFAANLAKCVPG